MNSMKTKSGRKKNVAKGQPDPSLSGMETLKEHKITTPAMKGGKGKDAHHTLHMGKGKAGPKKKQ
jgi:hypothetical protein